MKNRLAILAAGIAIGGVLSVTALLLYREYQRGAWAPDEAGRIQIGAEGFGDPVDAPRGLGPAFNASSCASCHNIPAIGGSGTMTTLRVARLDPDGAYRDYDGGPVLAAFSTPDFTCRPVIPTDANVFSRRLPISTFGSGLVDAIPDEALIALADPGDRDGDGVRGRAARVWDRASGRNRVGRFGWKAQQASLLAFTADAYAHEMGVTNDLYPAERVLGVPAERIRECDELKDPEDKRDLYTGLRSIDTFTAFMRSLPAPEPAAGAPEAGAGFFERAGCATCHRPRVGDARAYSDFLLHDIGTGDGIREGDAGPGEMRTPALWGIRSRRLYLHDGSATSIEDVIGRHGGEAARARERYASLAPAEQRALVAFVNHR